MAQLNITLNQDEILQLLENNPGDAFRNLLQSSLNSILLAESAEQLKAAPYERTSERTDSRNGMRDRDLTTRIGSITLHVPRHRNEPFHTMIFENYSRSEAGLIACMAEMVVNGVSTRKVSKVIETLCGTSYSKSAVSQLCKDLDKSVEEFRKRPLSGSYPFITVDATYFKVREDHRVKSELSESQINSERDRIFRYGVSTSDAGFAAIKIGVIPSSAAPSRFCGLSSIKTVSFALRPHFCSASTYIWRSGLKTPNEKLYVAKEKNCSTSSVRS